MGQFPTGTVTFMFTDIEGSTRLLQSLGARYLEVLEAHQRLVREEIFASGGVEISTEGDSFFCVFPTAVGAVAAAVAIQRALDSYAWPTDNEVRIRVGLHTGLGMLGGDDYVGLDVHRAARIAAAGYGGQVLLSDATRVLAEQDLVEGVSLLDLGSHRLKDLPQPEHLYQLRIEDLRSEFAPLRTLQAHPNNLPVQLDSFVGREHEIAKATALVEHNRLVTFVGPGGVGKTRLAVQAAAELLDVFPDGVWVVDLTATSDPALVPSLAAQPFGVRNIGSTIGRELVDVLVDYISQRDLLLILDNCEHVLEASAQLAESLLSRTEHVRIMATSRESLGVPGELTVSVPPLGVDEARDDADAPEAVRLFIDRAKRLRSSSRLSTDDRQIIAEIARQLDGLPLAIELAASRVNILTPEQILQRLEDRFTLLQTGQATGTARHGTLQATMDWSYELLSEDEASALRALSVFSGWNLEGAETVLDGRRGGSPGVLDLLASLVDKSLVEVAALDRGNRFRLLESVRHYAMSKLRAGHQEADARSAHARFFLDLAEAGDTGLRGPDQSGWLERIEEEHDNIRSALVWSLESGESETALRLTVAMGRFWFMRGYWMEAFEVFWRVRDRTPDADPILRARAVYATAAIQLIVVGKTVELAPLIEDAHTVLSENGTPSDVAFASYFLGVAKAAGGDSEAATLLDLSIRLFGEAADPWGEAYAKRWLGTSIELSGDAERSALMQREAVRGFEQLGDRWSAGWMAFDLGFSLVMIGDLDQAQMAFDKSLHLVEGLDDRLVVPHAKRGAALVASRAGHFELAKQLFHEALPILEQIGDENCINLTSMYLGDVGLGVHNLAEAKTHLTRSIQGFADQDNILGLGAALRRMGLLVASRAPERAVQVLAAAEAMRLGAGGSMGPHDRTSYDQALHTLRATLGDDSFDRSWASGEKLSQDDVIEHALQA